MVFDTALSFQFLIHVGSLGFGVSAIILCMFFLQKASFLHMHKILTLLSDSTLEVYLVQVTFRRLFIQMPFPISLILFFFMAFGGGILLHTLFQLKINARRFNGAEKE